MNNQTTLDRENAAFWDELCGSGAAQSLGIRERTPQSLALFDRWFLDFYPYLLNRYLKRDFTGKKILEVGLGYGTVGQYVAEKGAIYQGLDLARGPVEMMNYRMSVNGLNGQAVQGNMLNCPFEDSTFDEVISIGCFHHTGNVQACIDQTYRVLKQGGRALIMVYSRFSLRQWLHWPQKTLQALIAPSKSSQEQRAAYDCNLKGDSCPETSFWSIKQLRSLCSRFSQVSFYRENIDPLIFRGRLLVSREKLLNNLARIAGTDIYFILYK